MPPRLLCLKYPLSSNVVLMKYVITWLALAVVVGLALSSRNLRKYTELTQRGRRTEAAVVEIHKELHSTVVYRYTVDGRLYQERARPSAPNPPIDKLKIGDVVTAFYDPQQPAVSVLEAPALLLANEQVSVVAAALLMPGILVLSWRAGFVPGRYQS